VGPAHCLVPGQVRDGPRHPHHPVVAARREAHRLGGLGEEAAAGLRFMHLVPPEVPAELYRYIGHWQFYAISHNALDNDEAIQEQVRNAARTPLEAVQARRADHLVSAGDDLELPRQK